MNLIAIDLIKLHEGFRPKPYQCSAGFLTTGYGTNLEANVVPKNIAELIKIEITKAQADYLLKLQLHKNELAIKTRLPFFDTLNQERQAVLLDMAYNLGIDGFMQFKKTIALIQTKNFHAASQEMLRSKWATQVGSRATRLARIMLTGKWKP